MPSGFDRIAWPYRWLEYLSFGPLLERCRNHWLPATRGKRRALILGDGDGRFTSRLLRKNPEIIVEAVDISHAMLTLLNTRAAKQGAANRVTTRCLDALSFHPEGNYDIVVSHFFLDCFSTSEVRQLAEAIRPHLVPSALWVVSDFDIPHGGPSVLPAQFFIGFLYRAFGVLTGLETRSLPDHRQALETAGLVLSAQKTWLGGLLFSELWILHN